MDRSATYQSGGLLSAGLSIQVPEYDAIKAGTAALDTFDTGAASLVAWGYGFGARTGDILRISIIEPGGKAIFEHEALMEKAQAQYFRAAGRRASGAWPSGAYTARIELVRGGAVINTAEGDAATE